jgi:hypothetical protein
VGPEKFKTMGNSSKESPMATTAGKEFRIMCIISDYNRDIMRSVLSIFGKSCFDTNMTNRSLKGPRGIRLLAEANIFAYSRVPDDTNSSED